MPNHHALIFTTAIPADSPAISDLIHAAYAKWAPGIGREPRPMQVDYVEAVTPTASICCVPVQNWPD